MDMNNEKPYPQNARTVPVELRCAATTRKGLPCRQQRLHGLATCGVHTVFFVRPEGGKVLYRDFSEWLHEFALGAPSFDADRALLEVGWVPERPDPPFNRNMNGAEP